MQDLLQQLDLDYYRSTQLVVARAELERLQKERSTSIDVERRSKSPYGEPVTAERAALSEVACADPPYGGPGAVRRE
jgi:hypothetical protein